MYDVDDTIKVIFLACLAASFSFTACSTVLLNLRTKFHQGSVCREAQLGGKVPARKTRFELIKMLQGKRQTSTSNSDFIWTLETNWDRNKNLAKSVRLLKFFGP